MKKLFLYITIIISFFVFNAEVEASRIYKRGIVTKTTYITTQADKNSSSLMSDTNARIVLYSPEAVEVVGEEGNYYRIKFLYTGFVYEGYIPKSNIDVMTYNTDDSYEQNLLDKGFPLDYASKLAALHAIHPNWNFTPSYTGGVQGGMDFYTAVNGEGSLIARNVIDGKNTTLRSTADGAYQNGTWIPLAGNGWYAASIQTISFYLDPRNFLDESHIFMFENLGYNSLTQTKEAVNKVLSGTFMAKTFNCFDNSNSCIPGEHYFADSFLTAGIDKKVNPIHLASRVKLEQGSTGSVLSLGQGYNGRHIGFYNFFNIGASGKTDPEVIENGLKYAENKNWNNQHISIYDGSSLIASNYIARGQSTRYYQKFNTIKSPFYNNQYMQNVRAPYQESYSSYESYYRSYANREEWDNALYDFLIPVYQNMGSFTTLDVSQNGDSTLKSLDIPNCTMNPSFQSSAYEYDCYVKKDTKELNISAAATNERATVTAPKNVELTNDEQTIEIKVTAVNGTTSTYIIKVHRLQDDATQPDDILNGIGIKVTNSKDGNESYASNLEVGSNVSAIINNIKNKHHYAHVTIFESNGTAITEGIVKTGQMITISNAGKTSTYKIVLYGDTTGDGNIDIRDLLVIQKHIIQDKLLTGPYLKAADINKDNQIDIRDLLCEKKYIVNEYTISQE